MPDDDDDEFLSESDPDGRFSFTVTPFDIVSMHRKVEEKAHLLGVKVRINWLGGILKQTWAINIWADEKQVSEFETWIEENRLDIQNSRPTRYHTL